MPAVPAPTALLGRWAMARSIHDRRADEQSEVQGTTTLGLDDDGRVRWSESGTLTRKELVVPVSRLLFVEPRDDEWFVTFEDGRDFHPWSPGRQVVHPCAPDTYVGRVEIVDADRWAVTWDVTGPAKDYTMVTALTRDPAAGHPNEKA